MNQNVSKKTLSCPRHPRLHGGTIGHIMIIDLIGIDRAPIMVDQAGIGPAGQVQEAIATMMGVGGRRRSDKTRLPHCQILMILDRRKPANIGWQGLAPEIANMRIFMFECSLTGVLLSSEHLFK